MRAVPLLSFARAVCVREAAAVAGVGEGYQLPQLVHFVFDGIFVFLLGVFAFGLRATQTPRKPTVGLRAFPPFPGGSTPEAGRRSPATTRPRQTGAVRIST
ncbi:hypothetical protein T492DRAFT_1097062 [Pavlovales sp. CCMP2436]|nr:hypothetical protein T492DRAFT_1097062 [Pavlovales sp. CCMP2436]